jgi:hypothetical protein
LFIQNKCPNIVYHANAINQMNMFRSCFFFSLAQLVG